MSIIEKFFFWLGVILLSLSLYLFKSAHNQTQNLLENQTSSQPLTLETISTISIAEHEYINQNSLKLFGVAQYPKGSFLGANVWPGLDMTSELVRHSVLTKQPHLETNYCLNERITILFFNNDVYFSPIRLEIYPLLVGILSLILPFIGIIKRRRARALINNHK